MDIELYKFCNMDSITIIPLVKNLLEYLRSFIKNTKILDLNDNLIFINLIKEYHQFSKLRSIIGLMILIYPENNNWIKADELLNDYLYEYYNDTELFNILTKLPPNDFYVYLINKFQKSGISCYKEIETNKNALLSILQCSKKTYNSENIAKNFIQILLLRYKYAKNLNLNTYLETVIYAEDICIIKKILDDLTTKLCKSINLSINTIYNKYKKPLTRDILLHNYMSCIEEKILLKDVFKELLKSIKLYFRIEIEEVKTENKNINNFYIYKQFKCNSLGNIYIANIKNNNKGFLCINLEDKMKVENIEILSNILLLSNYDNWDVSISFNEVVSLYKEFGYVIRYLIYTSDKGLLNSTNEYDSIYDYMMEYILYDSLQNLYKLTTDKYNEIIRNKKMSDCLLFKLISVDSIYDHIIHNSIKFTENLIGNELMIFELYKIIFNESIQNKNIKYSYNVDLLYELVNGFEGLIYTKITNRIIAYSLYNFIKTNGSNNAPYEIFCNGSESYKKLLKNFSSQYKNNYIDFINYYTIE